MTDPADGMGRAVAGGASWYALTRIAVQILQFASGIALARLLAPSEFGSYASVYVIVGFAVVLLEGGMASALIHHRGPSEQDYSTVFWVNVIAGFVLAGALWWLAPLVSAFYNNPQLTELTPIVGLTFALSLSVVHRSIAIRQFRFAVSAIIESVSTGTGILLTLALAIGGAGAYALAIGPVVAQALASVGFMLAVSWRPRSFISSGAIRSLLSYSLPLVGATTAEYWGRNADNLLVGRYLGATELGFYGRAYNLMSLPITQVTNAVGNAVSPALARISDDPQRIGRAYTSSLLSLAVVVIPGMTTLALLAPYLVPILWGEVWNPAVPILQVLCIAAIPQSMNMTASWLYEAQSRTRTLLKMTLAWTAVGIIMMAVGLQWGAIGVAWAVVIRYTMGLPFEIAVAARHVTLQYDRLIDAAIRIGATTATVVIAVVSAERVLLRDASDVLSLLTLLAVVVTIAGVSAVTVLRPIISELSATVRRRSV